LIVLSTAPCLLRHLLAAGLLFPVYALALDASDLDDLERWTVAAITNVEDKFEGCDFDRQIRFDNGLVLTCSTYSYTYVYRPDAVIFVDDFEFKGHTYWSVKALIDDEFYEMQAILVNKSGFVRLQR
jgi:hypothetical protein